MMKRIFNIALAICVAEVSLAQIDPELLRKPGSRNDSLNLNMDAVYSRPFIQVGRLPVALGGYVEANYQYASTNGISEGHQFQFRRLTLFVSSTISNELNFYLKLNLKTALKKSTLNLHQLILNFHHFSMQEAESL
jgi:hypothetical protein